MTSPSIIVKMYVVFLVFAFTFSNGVKEDDRIIDLPGQPIEVSFSQFAGYVTVDPGAGRALFYYLAEAENAASTKPLLMWVNGGPGSSSLGIGALSEIRPFRVNPGGKSLRYNPHSWNKVANLLFLESPAFAGFSYSNRSSDIVTNDDQTAADSLTFLVEWLERFPEYKGRDFYLAGDSYAGHYVPQLAELVLRRPDGVINLKGFAIGNAYLDYTDVTTGKYEHLWTSNIISDETHTAIVQSCGFTSEASTFESAVCNDSMSKAYLEKGNMSFYDINGHLCGSSSDAPSVSRFGICSQYDAESYLNIAEVQKALHANITGLPGPWKSFNARIYNMWQDKPLTVLPLIQQLMASDLRIWIYSGDADGLIPTIATKYSMAKLGAPVKTPWYPWYHQGEVGGFTVEYENLTFSTVRAAGHYVPNIQPERALTLIASFLEGKLPPSS